jgi:4-deoxy-L-threo-5-hexosulose-uronate ketol-isomerase
VYQFIFLSLQEFHQHKILQVFHFIDNNFLQHINMKTNYELRYASHPEDAKHYDTARLRKEHLIGNLFSTDEVNMVYTLYDRLVVGGAMPVNETLPLESIDPLKSDYFLSRRELGIYNVGGTGKVSIDGVIFELGFKEALYVGAGNRNLVFSSIDKAKPAKFYFNSAPAHRNYPDKKVTKADAIVMELGSLETANHRNINKMLVREVVQTCQLQMGMTELATGSVWNTMPAHTHSRRMEAYFYFEVPEGEVVCHFMGEPTETRHIWMQGDQAVISPEWSIHSAAATSNYTFIWGMAGENLDYGDQDFRKHTELR